jgi:thiosulfate/3-mercaptopyruvate sulfurtransferase
MMTYQNQDLLVDVNWLEQHIGKPGLLVLDARKEGFQQGHIPGARQLRAELLKHPNAIDIAPLYTVREALEEIGYSDGAELVIYDDGKSALATRVFYVLEYYGLRGLVRLLHGGFTAWKKAGKPIQEGSPDSLSRHKRGQWTGARSHPELLTTKAQLEEAPSSFLLLDVRSRDEYTGADKRQNRKGGHIPGAVQLEWRDALKLDAPDGVPYFKQGEELTAQLEAIGIIRDNIIVPYCQLNSRGAHTYFILRLLGYPDVRPYEGAWQEWGNDDKTAVSSQ